MITDNTLLISIDLETLGQQRPRTAIATIGMAAYNLNEPDRKIGHYYGRIDRATALQVGKADQATLDWWSRQPAAARAEIEGGETPIVAGLIHLTNSVNNLTQGRDPSEVLFVARAASFDLDILDHHFKHFGMQTPWQYWQERDHRSLEDAYRDALQLLGVDTASYRGVAPVQHHALLDAIAQAEYLMTMRRKIYDIAFENVPF